MKISHIFIKLVEMVWCEIVSQRFQNEGCDALLFTIFRFDQLPGQLELLLELETPDLLAMSPEDLLLSSHPYTVASVAWIGFICVSTVLALPAGRFQIGDYLVI